MKVFILNKKNYFSDNLLNRMINYHKQSSIEIEFIIDYQIKSDMNFL